jgi:hypothetical protein
MKSLLPLTVSVPATMMFVPEMGDGVGGVMAAPSVIGDDFARQVERGVERAVRVVAGEGDVAVLEGRVTRLADGDDLAVGLERDAPDAVVRAGGSEVGGDFAARAEGRVERAVVVVADEREVSVARKVDGIAARDRLAVGLDGEGERAVVRLLNVGRPRAGGVERPAERRDRDLSMPSACALNRSCLTRPRSSTRGRCRRCSQ